MAICPVCLTEIDKHAKGPIVITRLDGSIVSFPQWQELIREEERVKNLEEQNNRA